MTDLFPEVKEKEEIVTNEFVEELKAQLLQATDDYNALVTQYDHATQEIKRYEQAVVSNQQEWEQTLEDTVKQKDQLISELQFKLDLEN